MNVARPTLYWNPDHTPAALHPILNGLAEEYPLRSGAPVGDDALSLAFEPLPEPGALQVDVADGRARIAYGTTPAALRGVGHALAGVSRKEDCGFETLGIMLDCSRGAVMKPACLKRWLRRLALLGYNRLMLYTEDVYRLPGEPFFGYKRGAYTFEEIRDLDACAAQLGIELIGCIQTLGHLEQILMKHDHYKAIRDSEFNLMPDVEASYALITKMIRFWSEALGSRRLHIGMDEAVQLGRGQYLTRFGYQPQFEIFNRHLDRVCAICDQFGMRPMIWSDMYFRLGSKTHDYYDRDAVIPPEIAAKISPKADLVYWDYYNTDEAFYTEWIRRHRALGKEPIMASGIWTWARFWYDPDTTRDTVVPCVAACRSAKVKDLWFTMWGDGGAYCDFESAMAGIAFAADLAYGSDGSEASVAPIFRAVCGGDYAMQLLGAGLRVSGNAREPIVPPSTPIWDDLLLGVGWEGHLATGDGFWENWLAKLRDLRTRIEPLQNNRDVGDMGYLWCVCDAAIRKVELREALVKAYPHDRQALATLRDRRIPEAIAAVEALDNAFRTQWLRRNKAFGMEPLQLRLGGVRARLMEAGRRIDAFLTGEIDGIEELDTDYGPVPLNPVGYFAWLAASGVRV